MELKKYMCPESELLLVDIDAVYMLPGDSGDALKSNVPLLNNNLDETDWDDLFPSF